jgi:hypothetical protein
VRLVRPITEDEMLAEFVRGELDSERYGEKVRALVARGLDPWQVLEEHRAYERRDGLFGGFPDDVDWYRALLSRDEVLDILYINWDWWLRISGGTRSAREAARRIRAGEVAGVTAEEHDVISRSRAPLIAVTNPAHTPLVLVEGHVRLTSYALFSEAVPAELELLVGISPSIAGWCQF